MLGPLGRKRSVSRGLCAFGLSLLALACGADRHVNPPPEGEWLEWKPKPTERKKSEPVDAPLAEKKKTPLAGNGGNTEDLDAAGATTKPSAPAVKCSGPDVTRESLCIALSELGGKSCPAARQNRAGSKDEGAFELPPNRAKRDPSLEASVKQCCYAWCAKIPSASPPVPCEIPEPLFCFEAPQSTRHAAPPPYSECPMGLAKAKSKGRRKATPNAAFSSKLTKAERAGEPKACCYQACK